MRTVVYFLQTPLTACLEVQFSLRVEFNLGEDQVSTVEEQQERAERILLWVNIVHAV